MDRFDLIVIGSGSGIHVASKASEAEWKVALVDKGPTGGTCLNNGCIPSKMLIYPADVVRTLQEARTVGVQANIVDIEFSKIMKRMHDFVDDERKKIEEAIRANSNVAWYRTTGEFIGDYTLKADDAILTAPKIVIASGARALIPAIPGLEEVGYLDNVSLLNLKQLPESLIIIGSGYIGCEYAHFFSAMGTDVTLIGRNPRILRDEDPEISQIAGEALSQFMRVITNHEVLGVKKARETKVVSARNRLDNKVYQFEADEILLAAGRRSNSDLLRPERTGVELNRQGWIIVNDYLETTRKDIWAFGDAIGKHMFRHTANYEANMIAHNLLRIEKNDELEKVDFHAVPHAVFTHPQVASVGLTESEALSAGFKVLIGRARYMDVSRGIAMMEEHGFVKVVLEEGLGRILGCSVIGSEASELVQQVVYLMNTSSQDLVPIIKSQVIHPTLSEVVVHAFGNLEHPYHYQGGHG